jgi:hypothetical protein
MSAQQKIYLQNLFKTANLDEILIEIREINPKKLISPLISLFFNNDNTVKFKAIYVFGKLLSIITNNNIEDARIIMRRLMWSLNDESGGIGWGAPEAMAEAMANNSALAKEYFHILLSYIREDGNFLEFDALRKGALLGLARLAPIYPDLFQLNNAPKYLEPYFFSNDETEEKLASICLSFCINHINNQKK